jgi:hypothetical protein
MTAEEAYERGQRDMRDRIIKQWSGWITNTIGGQWRAGNRPGRKPVSNVALLIRKECRVRPLCAERDLTQSEMTK